MALAQVSASLSFSIHNYDAMSITRTMNPSFRLHVPGLRGSCPAFPSVPVNLKIPGGGRRRNKAASFSIRCEQSTEGGNGLDVWLGRTAMVGFAVAITVEIATGRGLLENFGVTTPLPTVALALTGLIGVLTAVFIFQSGSKN